MSKFGFGSKTGIDYAGEQSGIVISQQAVTSADLARIGFGQSVAITPLQLCVAVSSAINGGEVLVPHLVKQIVDPTTQTVVCYNSKTVKNRVISPQTSEKIVAMLEEVAMRGGGKAASVSGYQIGGKTGTAQKFANGAIAQGKYVSSFIGFLKENGTPKYLVLLVVNEPQGQSYGSIVAAPFAGEVFRGIISCKNIAPME